MKKVFTFSGVTLLLALSFTLLAQTPQYYNYNNVGTSSNTFPFGQAAGKGVNWLFLAGDFNQPAPLPAGQMITKVYIFTTTGGTRTYTNLHILMAQSTITTLTTGAFYPGPWDTVYSEASATLTGPTNGWMGIQLEKPYAYDPTKSLVLFVGQCAATAGTGIYVRQNNLTDIRRVWSVGGCPLLPFAGGDAAIVNFGVDVAPAVPPYYNYNTAGGDNSFPMNQVGGKMCQWLVGPGEYNQPTPALGGGSITGFYFRISGTYPLNPTTYTNFQVLFGQTALTSLPTGSFYTGSMDTVYFRPSVTFQAAINTWLFIPLDVPFPYNPAQSLVIQVGQCAAPGVTGFSLTHTNLTGNRRCWSVGGCPFVYAGQGVNVVNNGILIRYPVGVSNNNNQIPNAYRLEQNYPNPFNPVTTINFGLPKGSIVKLTVYDVLGREVEVLVNEFRAPGNYSVNFDATNYASGVYLYKIETAGFVETKKMQLIK